MLAYLNLLVLWPRARAERSYLRYAGALACALGLATVAVVFAIQGVYALLWHPGPRRFGIGFNLASDAAVLSAHVLAAAVVSRAALRAQQTRAGVGRRPVG